MANKNPSPATRFKPGQSGNPKGSSKLQMALVGIKTLPKDAAAKLVSKYMQLQEHEVQTLIDSGELSALEQGFAKAVVKFSNCDPQFWKTLLDRTFPQEAEDDGGGILEVRLGGNDGFRIGRKRDVIDVTPEEDEKE